MNIIAFYSFLDTVDVISIEKKIKIFFKCIDIKGSMLLSSEGINGTIAVPINYENKTVNFLLGLGISKTNIKISKFDGKRIFNNFKIKKKKEIVTSDFGLTPDEIKKGQFIEPQEWDSFMQQEDVLIVDTRNNYEFRVGHFKNALDPNIKTFKDFKSYVEDNKEKLKKKKVAIYCTGGIRCEKAGPLMKKYEIEAYQLRGGILKYLEVSKAKNWNGECFVFDYRVALDKKLKPGKTILCHGCNKPMSLQETKSQFYKEGYSCERCYETLSPKRTRSLMDKRKYWKIALEV